MRRFPDRAQVGVLAILILALGACASPHMTAIPSERLTSGPEAGKSLIHFMRPSKIGGAIQSTIYDGDRYIGTISAGTRLAYQVDAGKRMFMIVGESADFMEATVLPDKTYFVVVAPRMGVMKARFSFRPMNGQVDQRKVDQWVTRTREVGVNEKGETWAAAHAATIDRMKNRYLPKWMSKPEKDQQRLHAESGR